MPAATSHRVLSANAVRALEDRTGVGAFAIPALMGFGGYQEAACSSKTVARTSPDGLDAGSKGAGLFDQYDSGAGGVRLFRERAGSRAGASLSTERAGRLLGEICRRVDGLPLAIELAAARVVGFSLEDISAHLDDLFGLLPQQARRADGAQRSLRATVEWSDALLGEEERRLPRRMAVFAGRFDLSAIKEVCAEGGQAAAQVADLTARLVEKSLLLKLGVALLECVGLVTGPERPHLDVLARIGDNLRVALERLLLIDARAALELAASLTQFWWIRGRLREGIGWFERALAAAPNAPAELRATARFGHGFLAAHDADDWVAAARPLDIGIELLASASEPPIILGMLLCPAQVLIAWHLQRGISGIPKSVTPARLRANLSSVELELTQVELGRISELDQSCRLIAGAFWAVQGTPWTLQTIWDEP